MRSRRNVLIFASAVVIVLVLTALSRSIVAQHDFVDEQNVIAKDDYRLTGTHTGDLVVIGNHVTLADGSHVTGRAALVGDTLQIAGTIGGDLTALGDNLSFDSTARVAGHVSLVGSNVTLGGRVDGDLFVSGKSLTILPDTQVTGTFNVCVDSVKDGRQDAGSLVCNHKDFAPFTALIALRNSAVRSTAPSINVAPASALLLAIFGMVILAGTSVLSVTLFPHQISRVEEALRSRPRGFWGVGIAVYVLGLGLSLLVIFVLAVIPPLGLLLVPVFLIFGLLVSLLSLVGLVTLALMIGDWLLRRADKSRTPPLVAALVGSVAISVVLAGITLLPFGFLLSFLALNVISSAGLGAALFTRAGTRSLRRSYFVTG